MATSNLFARISEKCRSRCCCFPDNETERMSNGQAKKTKAQLVRLAMTVCGIEFCYAAETAFVSPILLNLGVPVYLMTLVWCLSPILGFFLGPILGSLSDNCRLRLGRRRPFILLFSVGILTGLILVPRGAWFGELLGDAPPSNVAAPSGSSNVNTSAPAASAPHSGHWRHWGTALTIVGVMLLDFCCDGCQSPSRSYLLDTTAPEEQAEGLSTFTIMAGLGGAVGYVIGGVDWESTGIFEGANADEPIGGHVFLLVLFAYLACLVATVTAQKEISLRKMEEDDGEMMRLLKDVSDKESGDGATPEEMLDESYGGRNIGYDFLGEGTKESDQEKKNAAVDSAADAAAAAADTSLKTYLLSIVRLPRSMCVLCLTNLFSWMSLVSYSLYFTDFVGQSVFGGDPNAPRHSPAHDAYENGVRTGSFAMGLYSISCSIYSSRLEGLIGKFGAKRLYVGGHLIYSAGAAIMALLPYAPAAFLLSPTAGIMYGTLFTMPYILLSNYHAKGVFEERKEKADSGAAADSAADAAGPKRGVGTDVALVSSMVFVAQFLLSGFMGVAVHVTGSTRTVMGVASVCAAMGSICAMRVLYLDL